LLSGWNKCLRWYVDSNPSFFPFCCYSHPVGVTHTCTRTRAHTRTHTHTHTVLLALGRVDDSNGNQLIGSEWANGLHSYCAFLTCGRSTTFTIAFTHSFTFIHTPCRACKATSPLVKGCWVLVPCSGTPRHLAIGGPWDGTSKL